MPQQNKTRFAILGVLSIQPASGYRIKQFCDAGIAGFWNENYGHLYPMLRQMSRTGEIEPVDGSTSVRRSQQYRITETGRAVLRR
nr:PadR family transcriptional regulator [Clostridia bacterium]